MSYTKSIHISELNLIKLKIQAHINKSKSIEQELDSILNEQLKDIGKDNKIIIKNQNIEG